MSKNLCKNKYNRGMTLVELMVVIAIFAIISSVTIFNSGKLNSSTSTQNLADDIALSVRKAQGYAIGVHGILNDFNYGYGVRFTKNTQNQTNNAGSNKSFILFVDTTSDGSYTYNTPSNSCGTPTSQNECLEILKITSSDQISNIYLGTANSQTPTNLDTNSTIDILFKRPNPEPTFCYKSSAISDCSIVPISYVKIEVSNSDNPSLLKYITVYNTGQISVN